MLKPDIDRYYRILELNSGASPEEVRQAYRDLAVVWHPDRFAHSPRLQEKAQAKMKEINEAYAFLKTYQPGPNPRPSPSRSTATPRPSSGPPSPGPFTSRAPRLEEIRCIRGHFGIVSSAVFSPNGRTVLSGSYDKSVRVWNRDTGIEWRSFSHQKAVAGVAFSPCGRFALSGGFDNAMILWDTESRREVQYFGALNAVQCVAYSPDGRFALSAGLGDNCQLWEVATGREVRRFPCDGPINSVAFAPNGRTAIAGSSYGHVLLYDVSTGRLLQRGYIEHGGQGEMVNSVGFSFEGRLMFANSARHVEVFDAGSSKVLYRWEETGAGIHCLAISPEGRILLSGHADGTLRLRQSETGREIHAVLGHESAVKSIAFSRDGGMAVSGSQDKNIRIWRLS
jgi:WD40 repeat protein